MVRRGMPEGSRFGAGDGILKDMGLSSSSPVLQRVRKDGDGMRGAGDVATVYGEGESRGNAARVIWSFGMQTENGSRDKFCRSCPKPTNAKERRHLVKSWNPGPGRYSKGSSSRWGAGFGSGGLDGVAGWPSLIHETLEDGLKWPPRSTMSTRKCGHPQDAKPKHPPKDASALMPGRRAHISTKLGKSAATSAVS